METNRTDNIKNIKKLNDLNKFPHQFSKHTDFLQIPSFRSSYDDLSSKTALKKSLSNLVNKRKRSPDLDRCQINSNESILNHRRRLSHSLNRHSKKYPNSNVGF